MTYSNAVTYFACDDHNLDCEDNATPEEAIESLLDEDIGPGSVIEKVLDMRCPITVYRFERTEHTYSVEAVRAMMRDHRPDWFEEPEDKMQEKP